MCAQCRGTRANADSASTDCRASDPDRAAFAAAKSAQTPKATAVGCGNCPLAAWWGSVPCVAINDVPCAKRRPSGPALTLGAGSQYGLGAMSMAMQLRADQFPQPAAAALERAGSSAPAARGHRPSPAVGGTAAAPAGGHDRRQLHGGASGSRAAKPFIANIGWLERCWPPRWIWQIYPIGQAVAAVRPEGMHQEAGSASRRVTARPT